MMLKTRFNLSEIINQISTSPITAKMNSLFNYENSMKGQTFKTKSSKIDIKFNPIKNYRIFNNNQFLKKIKT